MVEDKMYKNDNMIFEGIALIGKGCMILSANENLEQITGSDMLRSGRLCVKQLTEGGECRSCSICDETDLAGISVFTGVRNLNGSEYYIRLRLLLDSASGGPLAVIRLVPASMKDAVTVNIRNFMELYVKTLESLKVLPWSLDAASMKLYNIFGSSLPERSDLSCVDFDGWLEVVHEEDVEKCMPALGGYLNGTLSDLNIEYRVMNGNGGWMWIRTTGNVSSRDAKGMPHIMLGFNQDITDLKMYEEQNRVREQKLRESESRLKNAMILGRMSPWEYEFKSDRFITDRQMSAMWGYLDHYEKNMPITREQLGDRIHHEDRKYAIDHFNRAIETGESFELVFRIVVDNRVKYMHFIGEPVAEKGVFVKIIGVVQDLTALRVLESKLERKYEGLKFITDRIGIGLWDFSVPEMTLYLMNNEYQMGSIGEDSLVITFDTLFNRIHPEDVLRSRSVFESIIKGSQDVAEIDMRFRVQKDYKWFHVSCVVNSRDEAGKPLTIRGLFQDITEKKEIEYKLYQSQKMEAIGRLAGGVAHDFNNILQVILGYGSLALMDADNDSEMFEFISNIVDSGEKARNLVRQLLLFARREKFNPRLVSVNELISGLAMMLKRVIGENITLNFIPDKEVMNIYGDSGQLEQVVMNLCINARDAIGEAGIIIIKTKDVLIDQEWPCFDSSMPPGHYVMISVSDNGSGIPGENIQKIFEPFFTTKEKHHGTGLGLATAYSIVKQHNGFLDLHSIEGKGSTFTIYLPVYEEVDEPARSSERHVSERIYSGRGTILVAEDDELIRRYTQRILTDSGFNVITAADGMEAARLYAKNKENIDMLILDVVMPKKNGWDLYKSINGPELRIPVVFMSGYDENLLPGDFSSGSPMRYVQKPFKYYSLIEAIQQLMERGR